MQRTFRPRKFHLYTGLGSLLFFIVFFSACLVMSVLDPQRTVGYLCMSLFWLAWVLLSGYSLAEYYQTRVVLDGQTLLRHGVFATRELLLDHSVNLKWRCWPAGGSVVARSPLGRLAIDFDSFERSERVFLIEYLREHNPAPQQTGWDRFCQRIALPLVELQNLTPESASPATHVILSRRRIDLIFLLCSIPIVVACVHAAQFGIRQAIGPAVEFLLLWLVLRFAMPKKGVRSQRVSAVPGSYWWIICFAALLAGMVLYAWLPWLGVLCWLFSAGAFAKYFHAIKTEDRRTQQLLLEQAKTADARWRALRPSC